MKEKKDMILELCGYLGRGVYYTEQAIKNTYKANIGHPKNIIKIINLESKKKKEEDQRLQSRNFDGDRCFRLNPKIDFSQEQEIAESKSIVGMAKTVSEIVEKQNVKKISNWIDNSFESKLQETVEHFVGEEFREEILPVLKQHIDKKIENLKIVTKSQIKECIKEVLLESLTKLQKDTERLY